jgi:hypothetical protein
VPAEEQALRAGPGLGLRARQATLKVVGNGQPSTALMALDEARFRELSVHGVAAMPPSPG